MGSNPRSPVSVGYLQYPFISFIQPFYGYIMGCIAIKMPMVVLSVHHGLGKNFREAESGIESQAAKVPDM
jgi:hypothetical protein